MKSSLARLSLMRPLYRRAYTAATISARAPSGSSVDVEPLFFFDEATGGDFVSPWHDVPLFAGAGLNRWNMVCEIPRGARAKMEVAMNLPLNPIVQARGSDGSPRFHGLDSIVNYGALPQTWEDPTLANATTQSGCGGDGHLLHVCEIGSQLAQVGDIYPVKIIGILGLIDDGKTDWKVGIKSAKSEARGSGRTI